MNFGRDKIHPIIATFIILLFKKKMHSIQAWWYTSEIPVLGETKAGGP
jgi:hypothetical protein